MTLAECNHPVPTHYVLQCLTKLLPKPVVRKDETCCQQRKSLSSFFTPLLMWKRHQFCSIYVNHPQIFLATSRLTVTSVCFFLGLHSDPHQTLTKIPTPSAQNVSLDHFLPTKLPHLELPSVSPTYTAQCLHTSLPQLLLTNANVVALIELHEANGANLSLCS